MWYCIVSRPRGIARGQTFNDALVLIDTLRVHRRASRGSIHRCHNGSACASHSSLKTVASTLLLEAPASRS